MKDQKTTKHNTLLFQEKLKALTFQGYHTKSMIYKIVKIQIYKVLSPKVERKKKKAKEIRKVLYIKQISKRKENKTCCVVVMLIFL